MTEEKAIDIERNQQSAKEACEPALEEHIDIEAAVAYPTSKHSDLAEGTGTAEIPQDKAEAPTTHEDAVQVSRQRTINTLRTIAITLLALQTAALQIVSTHREKASFGDPLSGYSAAFACINLFVAHVRLLAVPILFFCAGCEAQLSTQMTLGAIVLGTDEHALCRFIARRIWKTNMVLACYWGAAWLVTWVWPLPPINARALEWTPYYSTHEGLQALIGAPMAYALVLLLFDSVYAVCLIVLMFRARASGGIDILVATQARFNTSVAKFTFPAVVIAVWVYTSGTGYTWRLIQPFALFFSVGEDAIQTFQLALEHILYITNSPELHFPLLFIGAYGAGTQFLRSQIPSLAPTSSTSSNTKPSPLQTLALSLLLSFAILHCVCHAFPIFVEFLDVRKLPALRFPDPQPIPMATAELTPTDIFTSSPWTASAAPAAYAAWILYALCTIPYALVNVCLTSSQTNCDTQVPHYAAVGLHIQYLLVPMVAYKLDPQGANLWVGWFILVWVGLYGGYFAMIGEWVARKVWARMFAGFR